MNHVLGDKEIQEALSAEQIRLCYLVMHQLRPHLTDEQVFVEQVQRQIAEGYHLIYLKEGGEVKAVAGFRFMEFLAWGKVLYIDDLVTASESRKSGCGGVLLKWVLAEARKRKCDQVHLDSGPQRHDAHRLYLNHGFKIVAHHFAADFGVL